jgi:hypothetical protein
MNSQTRAEELMAHTTFGFAFTMSLVTVGIAGVVTFFSFQWGWPALGGLVSLALIVVLIQGPPSGTSSRPSYRRAFIPFIWIARVVFFLLTMVSVVLVVKVGGLSGWGLFGLIQLVISPLLVLFAYKLRASLFVAASLEAASDRHGT